MFYHEFLLYHTSLTRSHLLPPPSIVLIASLGSTSLMYFSARAGDGQGGCCHCVCFKGCNPEDRYLGQTYTRLKRSTVNASSLRYFLSTTSTYLTYLIQFSNDRRWSFSPSDTTVAGKEPATSQINKRPTWTTSSPANRNLQLTILN